jgi:hypothetical protein
MAEANLGISGVDEYATIPLNAFHGFLRVDPIDGEDDGIRVDRIVASPMPLFPRLIPGMMLPSVCTPGSFRGLCEVSSEVLARIRFRFVRPFPRAPPPGAGDGASTSAARVRRVSSAVGGGLCVPS